jgi:hypothetical protein
MEKRKIRFPCPLCKVEHEIEAEVELGNKITRHSITGHMGKTVTLFVDAGGIVRSVEVADQVSVRRLFDPCPRTASGMLSCGACIDKMNCDFVKFKQWADSHPSSVSNVRVSGGGMKSEVLWSELYNAKKE